MDADARTTSRAAGPTLEAGSLEESSAFLRAAGLVVDEVTVSRVTGHLELSPEHHTPWGVVHGGVYTTAIESAASIGASSAVRDQGQVAVGLTNTTHFLRSLSAGRVNVEAAAPQPGPNPATLAGEHHRRVRQAHRPRRGAPAERHRPVGPRVTAAG